jgi:hypothetical protein
MISKTDLVAKLKSKEITSQCLDGRDFSRLASFLTYSEAKELDWVSADATEEKWNDPLPKDWTEENIIAQLKDDIEFGFEKALDQRGLSAGMMYEVVKMWLIFLEDDLAKDADYAQYGLPLFKKVAIKYGFPNPIGADYGNEEKYESY